MSQKPIYPNLCQTFKELAAWTWNKLDKANHLGMAFNEETVTESLLLKLAERHAGRDLSIRAYTKPEEGTGTKATGGKPTGADWSFWFSDQNGKGIEVRVQAKRLFKSGAYDSLDGTGQQIKDLYTNRGKAIPLYVFYNLPLGDNKHWSRHIERCCKRCDCCWPWFFNISDWGCTYAAVTAIPAKNKPRPEQITPMKPWHCLVCGCPCAGSTLVGSLPERVVQSLKAVYDQIKPGSTDARFKDLGEISWELTNKAPEWVGLLNEHRQVDDGDSSDSRSKLDEYLDEHGLKGVAFIQEKNS